MLRRRRHRLPYAFGHDTIRRPFHADIQGRGLRIVANTHVCSHYQDYGVKFKAGTIATLRSSLL